VRTAQEAEAGAGAEGAGRRASEDDVRFGRVVPRPAVRPVWPRLPDAGKVALDDVAVDRVRKRRQLRGRRTKSTLLLA
jgi:hypothetical protein